MVIAAAVLAVSPWVFYGSLNAADLASTEVGLARGGREGGLLVPQNRAGRVAVKAAQTAVLTWGDRRLSPKGRKILRVLYAVGVGAVVVHNVRPRR